LCHYGSLDGCENRPVALRGLPFVGSWWEFEIASNIFVNCVHDDTGCVPLNQECFAVLDPAVKSVFPAFGFVALQEMLLCFDGLVTGFASW